MVHISLKPTLEKAVNGKKVIVVGPATTLEGKRQGSNINKFDIVIRTNDGFLVTEDMWEDYGSKCDILYLNNAWIKRNILKNRNAQNRLDVMRAIVVNGVRLIIVKRKNAQKIVKHTLNKLFPNQPKPIVGKTSYNWLKKREIWLKNITEDDKANKFYEPTMLAYILSDIMLAEPKFCFITGMDFYNSTRHWTNFYNKGLNQKRQYVMRKKNHCVSCDKEYLSNCLHGSDIKVDPIIGNLLNP